MNLCFAKAFVVRVLLLVCLGAVSTNPSYAQETPERVYVPARHFIGVKYAEYKPKPDSPYQGKLEMRLSLVGNQQPKTASSLPRETEDYSPSGNGYGDTVDFLCAFKLGDRKPGEVVALEFRPALADITASIKRRQGLFPSRGQISVTESRIKFQEVLKEMRTGVPFATESMKIRWLTPASTTFPQKVILQFPAVVSKQAGQEAIGPFSEKEESGEAELEITDNGQEVDSKDLITLHFTPTGKERLLIARYEVTPDLLARDRMLRKSLVVLAILHQTDYRKSAVPSTADKAGGK